MKKALLVRYGAYGDGIIITPVLRELKSQGYYIICNVSDKCAVVFKDNPNIDEFIFHDKDSVKPMDLGKHWDELKDKYKPDLFINFSESIECNLCLGPRDPYYVYSKEERRALCDKNYYEESFRWAGLKIPDNLIPELYFSPDEMKENSKYIEEDCFNILWCLSGSNKHKAYPYTEEVMDEILRVNEKVHFITVGEESCQKIEPENKHTTKLSGIVNMRTSMCLSGLVDLVISPDTGVLHASGCFTTPKIGLLGHTSIENITKHFSNDYSIEADVPCAPCFRLIYDHVAQCPLDRVTTGVWCQAKGIPIEVLTERIQKVINEERTSDSDTHEVPCMQMVN